MTDALETAVGRLERVSLDVLIGDASRQVRKDRKYTLPVSQIASFLEGTGLRVLEIRGRRVFNYESVYFDTPALDSYLGSAHRHRRRFKVRSRTYLDNELCWLEVKTKAPRSLNAKFRLPYNLDRRTTLTSAGIGFLERFDQIAPLTAELVPVLTTRYRRATLLETKSNSRVTIDVDVEWERPDGSSKTLPHLAVVETKTAGPPCVIDHRLHRAHVRSEDISKYCLGRAMFDPELPANKWNRILGKYFDWEPASHVRDLAPVVWITQPDEHEDAANGSARHAENARRLRSARGGSR
jgi:hypothetical protein